MNVADYIFNLRIIDIYFLKVKENNYTFRFLNIYFIFDYGQRLEGTVVNRTLHLLIMKLLLK